MSTNGNGNNGDELLKKGVNETSVEGIGGNVSGGGPSPESEPGSVTAWQAGATAGQDDQGRFRQRPGGALVPRLRRLLHPQQHEEGDARPRHPAREDRVRLRHRLLQPLPVLHEHLRHPLDPRPRAGGGDRPQGVEPRPERVGHHRRRRRPLDRRQPLDARHPPQPRPQHHPVQQPHLRPDEGAVLARPRALGKKTKSTPMGVDRQPASHPLSLAIAPRGDVRRPRDRHRHQAPRHDGRGGGRAQGRQLRRGLPELQHLQRRRVRLLHRAHGAGPTACSTSNTASR